ncbi:uncharacterized protein LOC143054364 [Mytilus galloprovincialis]|uniref:uncharacterized protein LOC143054364 n=1 Tax=Mytilus galloprovincialis TaxID=29158 RepID=UPI003F7B44B9
MPKSCCAVGCANHNFMLKKLSFHKFPKDKNRCSLWIAALKRDNPDGSQWEPTKNSVLCGEHFISGKPCDDQTHPDYIPTVFAHTKLLVSQEQLDKKLIRFTNARKRQLSGAFTPTQENKKLKLSPRALFSNSEIENVDPVMYTAVKLLSPPKLLTPSNIGLNKKLSPSEREMLHEEIDNLREEKATLTKENQDLNTQLQQSRLSASAIDSNPSRSTFYTGISYDIFVTIFTFLSQFLTRTNLSDKFPHRDQLFITLVKLRMDLPFEFIALQCGQANSTVNNVFWRWIDLMHAKLGFLVHWPDRETMQRTLPSVFKSKFPRLTSIVDCFEIFIDRPKNLNARAKVYSNYKKHSTVKVFICCNPLGSVTYLSKAWGGRVSDNELVRSSGFINPIYHHPGDQILADRGFTLQDDFAAACSAELIIPSFTKGKKQLSAKEVETSRKISNVRIHIERVIGLMKNRYTILKGPMSIVLIKSLSDEVDDCDLASIDKILQVCGSLTNLGEGIVYSEK